MRLFFTLQLSKKNDQYQREEIGSNVKDWVSTFLVQAYLNTGNINPLILKTAAAMLQKSVEIAIHNKAKTLEFCLEEKSANALTFRTCDTMYTYNYYKIVIQHDQTVFRSVPVMPSDWPSNVETLIIETAVRAATDKTPEKKRGLGWTGTQENLGTDQYLIINRKLEEQAYFITRRLKNVALRKTVEKEEANNNTELFHRFFADTHLYQPEHIQQLDDWAFEQLVRKHFIPTPAAAEAITMIDSPNSPNSSNSPVPTVAHFRPLLLYSPSQRFLGTTVADNAVRPPLDLCQTIHNHQTVAPLQPHQS